MAVHIPRPEPGAVPSAIFAVGMHALLFAMLFFSIRWQTRPSEPTFVEMVTSLPSPTVVRPPDPPPPPRVVAPPPLPKPVAAPPPPPAKAVPKVDIALEKEKERKAKEQRDDKAKAEKAAKAAKAAEAAEKAKAEKAVNDKARTEQQREEDLRAERARIDEQLKKELERDRQKNLQDQVAREQSQLREDRARRDADAKKSAAANAANSASRAGWISQIQSKIRGNVVLPDGLFGNPEAIFVVNQLITGDVTDVRLQQSSGNPAYDQAVERAIRKSSPLPRAEPPEVFEKQLRLVFRPN